MADVQLNPGTTSDGSDFDLSKAAQNKRGRRRSIDRLRPLFRDDPVRVSLIFDVKSSRDDKRSLMPVLCFVWTYDRGGMMFPDDRIIYVPAERPFMPPNIKRIEPLTGEKLVEEGVRFLQNHRLKLVASDPTSPILRLECRINKKSTTVASMTFKTDNDWLAQQHEAWRGF